MYSVRAEPISVSKTVSRTVSVTERIHNDNHLVSETMSLEDVTVNCLPLLAEFGKPVNEMALGRLLVTLVHGLANIEDLEHELWSELSDNDPSSFLSNPVLEGNLLEQSEGLLDALSQFLELLRHQGHVIVPENS